MKTAQQIAEEIDVNNIFEINEAYKDEFNNQIELHITTKKGNNIIITPSSIQQANKVIKILNNRMNKDMDKKYLLPYITKDKRYVNKLDELFCKFIIKFSGGNDTIKKGTAKTFYKSFLQTIVKHKGRIPFEVFRELENENRHGLNGVLYVNGYFNFKFPKGSSHGFFMKKYRYYKFS